MKAREVYLATARIYFAAILAQVCAAGLFIGVLGAIFTWGKSSAIFDLASGPHGLAKPQLGFLIGPALILILLPLVRRRTPHVAYTSRYRARLLAAAALWVVGFVLLVNHLAGLGDDYTLKAGAYIAVPLIAVGLLATVAMWPVGLQVALFDRRGGVEVEPVRH